SAERPNIIVILTDDMGYSDLGCYGSEIQTPHLDKLAQDGIRFTQMYNTSKCWTTRISLLTGLYHQRSDRDFANTSLAGEVLRPAGYQTWWSGKHHANFNPYDRGFDHFSGFLGGAINFWNPDGQTPREGEPVPGWGADYNWAFDETIITDYRPDKRFYATDTFTDWALEWIRTEGSKERPFFLYLAYNAPHWPLHAHASDIEKYEGVYDLGYAAVRQQRYQRQQEMGLFISETTPLSEAEHRNWGDLSPVEREEEALLMQIHAAMVDNVDQNIGRILDQLTAMGEEDNTLILFLTDNGASHEKPNRGTKDPSAPIGTVGSFEAIGMSWANVANTPLRKWKVQGLEGGICTPMIAHWPLGIRTEPNSICREPVHLIDLLPTFMELAGDQTTYPENIPPIDGVSLLPLFQGATTLTRSTPLGFQYGSWKSLRDGPWKLVQQKNNPWALYDLSQDRTETTDLAAQNPERVASMEKQWNAWYQTSTGKIWSDSEKKKE
ncbi:MAG: arylsulfatase, partial [Verrucomicrobiota bacterium]